MDDKATGESVNPEKKEQVGKKMPLVSCDKYDEEERKSFIKEEGEEAEEIKVEPIHPSEQRGGKKKSLLDTCK
ncbi:MAG TPA: hypothetical protein HA306_09450 [Methanosarcina sp.]|nr:hypothetical protein [Methanosarcina sp.]